MFVDISYFKFRFTIPNSCYRMETQHLLTNANQNSVNKPTNPQTDGKHHIWRCGTLRVPHLKIALKGQKRAKRPQLWPISNKDGALLPKPKFVVYINRPKVQVQFDVLISSFNFKFQFQVWISSSISSFNFKIQFQVSISSFNFKFQFQVSNSSFNFKFQLQISSFYFKFQFQISISSSFFKF